MPTLQKALDGKGDSHAVLVPGGPALTYRELAKAVDEARKTLASTGLLAVQDAISMSLVNGLEFTVAFLAVGLGRHIAAPLNPAYTAAEADFYLQDSKSKVLLVHKGAVEQKSQAVQAAHKLNIAIGECSFDEKSKLLKIEMIAGAERGPIVAIKEQGKAEEGDVALLLHTSGTTGRPKAVPLTHRNLTRTMENIQRTYELTPQDRTMLVMPLFHVHGLLAGLLAVLGSGGSSVIPPKFAASSFWKDYVEYKCSWYTAVPTIHQILLNTPKPSPLPKIRFIRSCSSALSPATFHQIEEAFNAPVLEAYAMTEAAHQMCANPLPKNGKRKPGAVGPGQGVEVCILDAQGKKVPEGEVCVRGANITPGYLNNEKANAESFTSDRWFRTGDQGKLDEDGYVVLTGRIKELINKGGEKISPLEIDGALLAIKGVSEAVSFSVEDSKYGEIPWAAVVLKKDAKLSESDLQTAAGKSLAKFKVPHRIFVTDAIPKSATGKVQRRFLGGTFKKIAEKEQPRAKL